MVDMLDMVLDKFKIITGITGKNSGKNLITLRF